jgi:uncharacterized membrane protein
MNLAPAEWSASHSEETIIMKHITKSGAAIAAAALSLAMTGLTLTAAPAQADTVKCQGVNACKGQAACKGANNSCAGQAACKGQGWINTSSANCEKWGGKVISG